MTKKILTGLCAMMMSLAIGGCDEASIVAEEDALANVQETIVDDEDEVAEPRISVDEELDDLAAPVEPAADDCSDQYMEYTHSFQACGTCANGRINNITKRYCFGTGAWCPKECTGWQPHISPCVPC